MQPAATLAGMVAMSCSARGDRRTLREDEQSLESSAGESSGEALLPPAPPPRPREPRFVEPRCFAAVPVRGSTTS